MELKLANFESQLIASWSLLSARSSSSLNSRGNIYRIVISNAHCTDELGILY